MGKLIYGSAGRELEIEDRALAHLKIVVLSKLRRGESLALSWARGLNNGSGRSTVWLHPAIAVEFVFSDPHRPQLDRQLIDQLLAAANSPDGINLHAEPAGDAEPADGAALR